MRRRALAVAVALLLVLAVLVWGGVAWWGATHRDGLQQAVRVVPAPTKRLFYTDWADVRARTGATGASPRAISRLVNRGYDLDLTSGSDFNDAVATMQRHLGFSPVNLTWEAMAQATRGATVVMRADDVDLDQVADKLRKAGFQAPRSDDGVWRGGIDLVASIGDGSLPPELQYVALLRDQHLIVTSNIEGYAAEAARVAAGDGAALSSVTGVEDMADRVPAPASAVLWSRDFACADLAMSRADAGDQVTADRLVAQAGEVSPLSGLLLAMAPDRSLSVAEQFESADQAQENLRPRARLAVGPAPGRAGAFSDAFRLTSARSDGSTVLLTLRPKARVGYVISDLNDGPLLFATC